VTPELFYPLLVAVAVAGLLHLLFFKEFTYITFDPETARTQGYNAVGWEMFFFVIAATVVSFATHVVGDIFVFGFLVVPASAAIMMARKVKSIFIISVLIGVLAPPIGLYLAFAFDLPSSPASVGVASALLGGVWIMRALKSR
jgi:iron/zinc/copper transport system permease protein